MTLILLAVSFTIALTVIAFKFAVYALPFMVGLAAFRYVHATDAGLLMSVFAAFAAAGFSFILTTPVLAFTRNPILRLAALAVFAAPAAVAGYALMHGVARSLIESSLALSLLSGAAGLFVGIAAMMNINATSAGLTSG